MKYIKRGLVRATECNRMYYQRLVKLAVVCEPIGRKYLWLDPRIDSSKNKKIKDGTCYKPTQGSDDAIRI